MAIQSTLDSITSNPISSLRTLISESLLNPLLTGSLLLYIRRNPSLLHNLPWPPAMTTIKLLPIHLPLGIPNSITLRTTPPLKTLKYLFAIGLVVQVNRILNRLALNYWHVRKQGEAWDFAGEGKETILVTGGCSGFGREMVKMFAAGTRANIVVLDVQELPDDIKDLPRLSYFQADLTSPSSITSAVDLICRDPSQTPTVLINNAGIAQAHTILETTDAWLDKIFRVNLLSHFTLIRLLLPKMMARRKGHIVSIASMASYTGTASLGDYSATKAGVLSLHESLVAELATRHASQGGHCIQASIVHPMWARTPLVGSWEKELARSRAPVLEPTEVASRVVAQVLRARSGSVFVPEKFWVGALLRAMPDWVGVKSRIDTANATARAS
ncbi:uncharacterized protein Z520_01273 [Fonsecaea multimorphosa CBS 102226]|uniref:Uncharacterized protein n=1 Tax=Fonsecaea multimorphosa CBS 102226 TaxID=1442371 RepID=A0A0D2K9T2_9EURO|nr:uncharacterized protein Z520_01273 [Fonsecaea multimorphosa CBS 102226]KIY02808.1 hypothetical protein Z520_01273 [Fonsecaea multimorphosa CBS 102226]OAL30973.1 hypothetical protein AYO22_01268 [Fonsecaea multimorphosa]